MYDIDSILLDNDENREPNPYFNVYRINMYVNGSSGSGKSSFIINLLLNDIIPFEMLILMLPLETKTSGIWSNFIKKFHKIFPDKTLLIFDISEPYEGLYDYKKIKQGIIEFNGFPYFSDIYQLKRAMKIKNCCIIFDDFVTIFNKKQWNMYFQYIHNASRLNSSLISATQDPLSKFPPSLRNSFSIIVIFTNYLSKSNIYTLFKNTVNISLTNDEIEMLIKFAAKDPNKAHIPYIIIGGDVEKNKQIIYDNQYITFN